jgi:UPF0716 family protein affecting phage T7 exclusion
MRKSLLILFFLFFYFILLFDYSSAQCSICTKTAQQMGEKPAKGMNSGILYLAAAPFIIAGFIYYKLKKHNRDI